MTTAVKERGILFRGEMVRAILVGLKTQTRRIIKPQPVLTVDGAIRWKGNDWDEESFLTQAPHGLPGDRLWVRETWRTHEWASNCVDGIIFKADGTFKPIESTSEAAEEWVDIHDNGKHGKNWRPSIFMPRWASRITLEIVRVGVERLDDISDADALAEGCEEGELSDGQECYAMPGYKPIDSAFAEPSAAYVAGFRQMHELGQEANPWLWVLDFKRIA